jgi:hypothetical protein
MPKHHAGRFFLQVKEIQSLADDPMVRLLTPSGVAMCVEHDSSVSLAGETGWSRSRKARASGGLFVSSCVRYLSARASEGDEAREIPVFFVVFVESAR